MTFGPKLKSIRARLGWSQEELADKLSVSRQSITKWESNDGLPDTFNAKQMAQLFGVSIDYLLDNERDVPLLAVRLQVDPSVFGDKKWTDKADVILNHYFAPDYTIYSLTRVRKWGKLASLFDFFIGAGTVDMGEMLSNNALWFLAERNNVQQLVEVSKSLLTIREIDVHYSGKLWEKRVIDGYSYSIASKPLMRN